MAEFGKDKNAALQKFSEIQGAQVNADEGEETGTTQMNMDDPNSRQSWDDYFSRIQGELQAEIDWWTNSPGSGPQVASSNASEYGSDTKTK